MRRSFRWLAAAWLGLCFTQPRVAEACSACFGKSDSSLATGMNWGIAALLAVVLSVLTGIAAFFIYLAKRANSGSRNEPPPS